jgi:hypothetical protein
MLTWIAAYVCMAQVERVSDLPRRPDSILRQDYQLAIRFAKMSEVGKLEQAIAGIQSLRLIKPININVESLPLNQRRKLRLACETACTSWNQFLGRTVFLVSNNPGVKVVTGNFEDSSSSHHVLGEVQIERKYYQTGKIFDYEIIGQLRLSRLHDGKELTQEESQSVVLHELGHILGLRDSEDLAGLMGPYTNPPKVALSINEQNDLVAYRAMLESLERKLVALKEARDRG